MNPLSGLKTWRRTVLGALGVLGLGAAVWWAVHAPRQAPLADRVIDAATRDQVVEQAADLLERYYVFPERGSAIARQLRERAQQGDFARIDSAIAFADALTETLQAISADEHLAARYFDQPLSDAVDGDGTPEERAAELLNQTRFNFGFAHLMRLKGNVGLIELRGFGRPAQVATRTAAAMQLIADTRALVIDLRECGGGDPEGVMQFASYLFDQPTHLNDIYWRDEDRTDVRWTTADVAGVRYGQSRKLYLLISGHTFSACEDFAYALKNAGRALLVGETTGGGAHAGSPRRLNAHFMLFVPTGRPINPVTGTDWEGVGVQPDVPVSASDAQDTAHIEILKHLIATETDPDWRERLRDTLEDLD
ncbi:MAG: S41 family peptidase [Lysobacterales bacterium]